MELKHKLEWPEIIRLSEIRSFTYDNKILLLALREIEDGEEGHEFNRLDAMGITLEAQTRAMIRFIQDKEKEYQKYIARTEDEPFSFIEYISISNSQVTRIHEAMELVKSEFEKENK